MKLLYSTAYHSQTDGSSERTNQTVEIALRFFVHALEDPSLWPEVLPQIQSILNNTSSSTTGKTPNEVAYGFSPRRPLDLLSPPGLPAAFQARADAADAISFALANQKAHYNRKHQPLFLKIGDWAMLRLHKGYSIPSSLGDIKKLTQQFVGPFRVLERVGRLAYKLDVPQDWRIYPVFSIAQLEPAPSPAEDPFGHLRPEHPPPVFVEGDTDAVKSFEIDRLLNKRTVKKGRGHAVEYLVRWTGYGPEWDRWYNIKDLDNATKLVRNYEEAISQRRRWALFLSGGRLSRYYPFYPYLFIFLCHFPLYYLHVINPNRVSVITWLHLISLSSYVTRGKYRCRLSVWSAEPALLVDRVYTGRTPFQGYSGVDYLDRVMPTFNKSSFYHQLNCHLDNY